MGFFSYFVIEIGSINFFLKLFMWKLHILKGSLVRGSRNEPLRHSAQRTRDCQVFNVPANDSVTISPTMQKFPLLWSAFESHTISIKSPP